MAPATDMVVHAQQFRVNPPAISRMASGEGLRAGQNLRAAESQSQAAVQNTRAAQTEEQQARSNLQAAQIEEQRAGERVRAAQADYQRVRQPGPVQLSGVNVNIFV